ncbi:MAG: hypothetical protein QX198_02685 [Methylococcaceae bacterium]
MIGSVGGSGALGLATAFMKQVTATQDIEVAVIKKGQDIEKAQGDSALKLIDSASSVTGTGRIDLYA